ncbi:recombinase family protein [Candidatus Odyssella thessalonicensis]|uniref:recombinase family protein n=1 Tax=Candidatus Odyssella thessalonicensis TaxID=84647 RepID=UPI000225B96F|nr:recombinase family protein [Candidatus Odyssella thessalonicensis]
MTVYVGYARVSSQGQSLDIQRDKLKHCPKIFEEKKSGTTSDRPELKRCLEYVREGDTLVITKLDRLARSTLDLCNIADELQRKNVALQVIDQNINTNDATGRLLFNMLGAIAQFETEIRAERQADGISKALEKGVKFGRKYVLTPKDVEELKHAREAGETISSLMRKFRLSKSTVYRYLRKVPE